MNFDRNYQTKTASGKKFGFDLVGRIQSLSTLKRVYLYISLMALVGAATGAVKHRVEAANCSAESCWAVESEGRQTKELGAGAVGGAIAATLISLPVLVKEK